MLEAIHLSSHASVFFHPLLSFPKRGRVLIADDQPDCRLLYKKALGMDGWEVIEAENGLEALTLVMEELPDVLVLDNHMPEMNGDEVIHRLRALDFDIPTVLVTAAAEAKTLAQRLGIERYLGKPFKLEELKDAVQFARSVRQASAF